MTKKPIQTSSTDWNNFLKTTLDLASQQAGVEITEDSPAEYLPESPQQGDTSLSANTTKEASEGTIDLHEENTEISSSPPTPKDMPNTPTASDRVVRDFQAPPHIPTLDVNTVVNTTPNTIQSDNCKYPVPQFTPRPVEAMASNITPTYVNNIAQFMPNGPSI